MVKCTFLELFVKTLFSGVLVCASVYDIRERRIPNICCLAILGLGLLDPCPDSFLGAVCISAPMLLLSVLTGGSFGGGDIKLMASGGFLLGVWGIVRAFVIGVISAGMYCIYLLLRRTVDLKSEFALGPFLSLGMIVAFLYS